MSVIDVEIGNLVDGFSRAAFHRNAAWFIGAGASRSSGLMTWADLLRPLAKELGLELNKHDDLPAVAQYYINKASGNRGPLVQHMKNVLGVSAEPSAYHRAIARSSVSTIWTTNYDSLMEEALAGLKYRVRVRESDFVELTKPGTIEVIKAHGSFGISSPHELVISSEDYEDYAHLRPAMIERVRSDLLTKSFLFLGYSYGDPNIHTALVEARRLAERASLTHWMLAAAVPAENIEEYRRQQLWKIDLERMGIRCVIAKDYDHIEEIVTRVASHSRGPTIYVTGSHVGDDPQASKIGQLLAKPDAPFPILLDGQSAGVSRAVLSAFQAKAVDQRIDLNERLRFFPNPYAADPRLSDDPALLPILKQLRGTMLRQAHTVLAFDGGMGTQAETEIAIGLGCRIVPVPRQSGGSASDLLSNKTIVDDLELRSPGYVKKAKSFSLTPEDVVDCLLSDLPAWPH